MFVHKVLKKVTSIIIYNSPGQVPLGPWDYKGSQKSYN